MNDPLAVSIRYMNHRGVTAVRRIVPSSIRFAATQWHPEPQWLLEAIDLDKQAVRSFAMRDILEWLMFGRTGEGGLMQIEPIDLAVELRQIANEMDRAGSSPVQEFCGSRYNSDILRDAAAEIERLRSLVNRGPCRVKD